jgi:hypothetical protein
MSKLDPVLLASRWICRDLLPEVVPQIAIELIEAGHENPAVSRLAAEDKINSRDDVEALLKRMFSALEVEYPISLEEARKTLARQIAREVASGLKNPWIAAAQLDRVAPHWEMKDENIRAVYSIADEAGWDPGYGRRESVLEQELIRTFEQIARS